MDHVDVLLESLVFGLIGLELPFVLKGISDFTWCRPCWPCSAR